jgi:predicted translin family RNA/ssDNA-binding protein
MAADLTLKLRPFLTVIVVDVYVRGIADRTGSLMRNFLRVGAVFNRAKRFAVVSLILEQKDFIVFKGLNGLFS